MGGRRTARARSRSRKTVSPIVIPPSFRAARSSACASPARSPRKPKLIICDEPTSALDPLVAEGILKLLTSLQRDTGVSYLFIAHDIATVRAIADLIAVMHNGRVVRFGSRDEVLAPPFDDYTELLLASVRDMRIGWLEEVMAERRMTAAGN